MLANKGGWSLVVPNQYVSIRINGARGNDMLIVDGTVTTNTILRGSNGDDTIMGGSGDDRIYGGYGRDRILGGAGDDTIVTVGDSVHDRVTGGAGFDTFWADSAKTEIITDVSTEESAHRAVNRIGAFYAAPTLKSRADTIGAVASRDLAGQDLPDPAPAVPSMVYADFSGLPLFSSIGPLATDVGQGQIGDCYFLAPLASLAQQNPDLIRRLVVELGDGTFAVRFESGGTAYVRVDADLPTWRGETNPVYAALGAEGSMWVALIEKAFAFIRRGEATYASIDGGWLDEAYPLLGVTAKSINRDNTLSIDALARIKTELDAGAAMTWATYRVPAGIPLVSYHAYSIDAVHLDAAGRPSGLRLLNPWGTDGMGDDGADDGYITLTAQQAAAVFVGVEFAYV